MKLFRLFIDFAMLGSFVYLTSYHAGLGVFMHGLVGCAAFAQVGAHLWLNRAYLVALIRGKTRKNRLSTALNLAMLALILAVLASAFPMSGKVFEFSCFRATQTWLNAHIFASSWLFALAGIHLGLMRRRIFKFELPRGVGLALCAVFVLLGVAAAVQTTFWSNLILAGVRKSAPVLEWLEYAYFGAIALGFAALARALFNSNLKKIRYNYSNLNKGVK